MKIADIEIPLQHERGWKYRLFEIMPGLISWTILALPIALSFVSPTLAAYFILLFMLSWLVKAFGYAYRTSQGYRRLSRLMRADWLGMLDDLNHPKSALIKFGEIPNSRPKWHRRNLIKFAALNESLRPKDINQIVIIATYNEALNVLEPTIEALLTSRYDPQKINLLVAYEERGGQAQEQLVQFLIKKYDSKFKLAKAIKHPADLPAEVIGKGPNLTFAGRWLISYLKQHKLDPTKHIVTTLDADHRVHPNYFASLTYNYLIDEDRKYKSYQPIPMFFNNIWDAPAPMRVLATGNSFWNLIVSTRPHLMRNFAAHSQGMATLIDTDLWTVRSIVEDGHQFWRTYFRYDGRHDVVPIYVPVFQDAVLAETYRKTLKAQFIQLRRWAYGASDIAYVIKTGFLTANKVAKRDLFFKLTRLVEAHVSWATTALILAGAAWLPILINPDAQDSIIAHQLPRLASGINTFIAGGILVTVFLSMKMLPPRPPRYRAHRNVLMVLQWVLLPVSSIVYGSFAALYSQTRLMLGRYLEKFDVTDKVRKSELNDLTD
ncbi:MAG TPA: glycosyltransferase family 2 protein [Candidatus Saccharimonadales bacterium]